MAESLTRWEWKALEEGVNLADGHARQVIAGHEEDIISQISEIYKQSYVISQDDAQNYFLQSYFNLLSPQQVLQPWQPLYHYSSSLAIDTVAKLLNNICGNTLLISPTFDNIPALLRRNHVKISPVLETDISALFRSSRKWSGSKTRTALFLVNPNNPTGHVITENEFRAICDASAKRNVVVVVDNSFRAFRPADTYDDLELMRASGCSFVSIEDSGKMFSTNDIKLGFLLCSDDLVQAAAKITDEIMLNVSPFSLLFLKTICDHLVRNCGMQEVIKLVMENRSQLENTLKGTELKLRPSASPIGVGWIALPAGWSAEPFVAWLSERGFGALPGVPFYWHEPKLGTRFVRLALMRNQDYFSRAMERFWSLIRAYQPAN